MDDALAEYVDTTGDAAGAEALLRQELGDTNYERALAEDSLPGYQKALERTSERQWDLTDAVEDSTKQLKEFGDFVRGQTDPLFRLHDAQEKVTEAQKAAFAK